MSELRITDEATCLKGEMLIVQSRAKVISPKRVFVSFDDNTTKEFVLAGPGLAYGPLNNSYEVTTEAESIELTCVPKPGGFPVAELGIILTAILIVIVAVKRLQLDWRL